MNTLDDDLRVRSGRVRNVTRASSPKFAPKPGTRDISALDREARESRGPVLRILVTDVAAPCVYDLDRADREIR